MTYNRLLALPAALLCGVLCAGLTGCGHASATRTAIRNALSGNGVSVHDMALTARLGEDSVPSVYDEIRRDPTDLRIYLGGNLLIGIATGGRADPSAPYIRRILDDGRQSSKLRLMSAEVLAWYTGREAVRDALVAHAKRDADIAVRDQCVRSLGTWYYTGLERHRVTAGDPAVQRVLAGLLHDRSATVRRNAYEVMTSVVLARLQYGVDATAWAESALRGGLQDKNKLAKEAALEGIAEIRQERRRHCGQPSGRGTP